MAEKTLPENVISTGPGTIGVREMPDHLDSGRCHLRDGNVAIVRVNLDGVWTSLCEDHRNTLISFLFKPHPKP
jgi:hypothetical protein